MQSTLHALHVALVMDGNGRWAAARGRPRLAGHRAGARVVRRIVEAAPGCGIGTLTLYAFSADNWRRPAAEVAGLMHLFGDYLRAEVARCLAHDVRLSILGRRDRIPTTLVDAIADAERATANGRRLHLRVALDYSARDAILRAAACLPPGSAPSRESFGRLLSVVDHGDPDAPPVDLLVRTGGERRLSDFLLWECAYAELHFTPRAWPDFRPGDLAEAVAEFRGRQRRFGGLAPAALEPAKPAEPAPMVLQPTVLLPAPALPSAAGESRRMPC